MSTISVNSNSASLNAQRRFGDSTRQLEQSFARLSSGLRINRASDDAAGLSVASALDTDRRVLSQGVRNLNDGLSLLDIAEGALRELSSIVIRINELASQAANGALSNAQRGALNEEAQSLAEEYSRISQSAEFNGRKLFDASVGSLRMQVGYGSDGGIVQHLGGALGTGTFAGGLSYASVQRAHNVTLSDLNRDGYLDIFVEHPTFSVASIFFGQSGGTFGAEVSFGIGTSANFVQEDFNNDGSVDLLSTFDGLVFLGNGNGTFRVSSSFGFQGAVGDYNHDGVVDLAAVVGSALRVSLGNGDGSFRAYTSFALGSSPGSSTVAFDINNDGRLDLVGYGVPGPLYAMLGNGDGTFGVVTTFVVGSNPNSIQLADVNNDGVTDVLTSNSGGSSVSVLLGNGNGSFRAKSDIALGAAPREIVAGDFNGDGNVDFATPLPASDRVAVYLGLGNGAFNASLSFASGDEPRSIAAGDVDGDGVLDLITGDYYGNTVSVYTARTTSGVAPLLDFSLETRMDALQAMPLLRNKLSQLTVQSGTVGAFQARITTAVNTAQIARENFASAGSQITDVDVAEEGAKLVRQRILQQAGSAILAQANLSPSLALTLLGRT